MFVLELNALKQKADELCDQIKNDFAAYSQCKAAFIADDSDNIFMGVSGLALKDGAIVQTPADLEAVRYMKAAGSRIATAVLMIDLKTGIIIQPSAEALNQLFALNPKNDKCSVMLAGGNSKTIMLIRLGDSSSMMDGFDFDMGDAPSKPADAPSPAPQKADAPEVSANVITGVNVDENNPFYEESEEVKPPEDIIADENDEKGLKETDIPDPELTPEQLLAQAKKRKKVARSNFLFRRRK